jgi:hypothetical protein
MTVRRARTLAPLAAVLCGFVLATGISPSFAGTPSPAHAPRPYHELYDEPRVVAWTPGLVGAEFTALLDRVEAAGLHAPVAVVGAGIVLVDAPGLDEIVAREPHVARVLREPTAGALRADAAAHPTAAGLLAWWEDGFDPPAPPASATAAARSRPSARICGNIHGLPPQPVRPAGLRHCPEAPCPERVHFAAGRVVATLIFPDGSAGGGSAFPPDRMEIGLARLIRAHNYWNLKTERAATFVIDNRGAVSVTYPPETTWWDDHWLWQRDALESLGYDFQAGQWYEDVNADAKAAFHADWGYTQFLLHANEFPGAELVAGYAYLGGPLTVTLLWYEIAFHLEFRIAFVLAHELGHIFQALDEYEGSECHCLQRGGYLDFPNYNCVTCDATNDQHRCLMGYGSYWGWEQDEMETYVNACYYTRGMMGVVDDNRDGVLDVLETNPQTVLHTALPDTLLASLNTVVEGSAWDLPFVGAPDAYEPTVTISEIHTVEFRTDGHPWEQAEPADGWWQGKEEDFVLRLPALGGGEHTLQVRAVNSVLRADLSPAERSFFVYDVMLRREFEVLQAGSFLVTQWTVDGEDFGSTYRLYRQRTGDAERTLFRTLESQGGLHDRFQVRDETVVPGEEYAYELEVAIPGKGVKHLGTGRQTVYLAPSPEGHLIAAAPNPFVGEILLSVTVPRVSQPALRDDPGSGANDDAQPLWRDVALSVHDIHGRLVSDLGTVRKLESSTFNVRWNGRLADGTEAPPGIYFVRMCCGEDGDSRKVVLLR